MESASSLSGPFEIFYDYGHSVGVPMTKSTKLFTGPTTLKNFRGVLENYTSVPIVSDESDLCEIYLYLDEHMLNFKVNPTIYK